MRGRWGRLSAFAMASCGRNKRTSVSCVLRGICSEGRSKSHPNILPRNPSFFCLSMIHTLPVLYHLISLFPEPMWKSVFWQLVDSKKEKGQKGIQCFLVYFMCLLLCYLWRLRRQCTKRVETSVMAWLLAVYLLMTMLMIIVYMCKYRTVA